MTTVNEAVKAYLADRQSELSDSSIQNHRYQLKRFREWCGGAGELDHVEEIEPIDLSKFRRTAGTGAPHLTGCTSYCC